MKVSFSGQTRYFSWWPATKESFAKGVGRSNPASYGANAKDHGVIISPVNDALEEKNKYFEQRESDKAELGGRRADYKFIFTDGLDTGAIWAYWISLYNSEEKWSRSKGKNCNGTCISALQAGSKNMVEVRHGGAHMSPELVGADQVYAFCLRIARHIKKDGVPSPFYVRMNPGTQKNPTEDKCDFDPLVWNPFLHTKKANFDYLKRAGQLGGKTVKHGYGQKAETS